MFRVPVATTGGCRTALRTGGLAGMTVISPLDRSHARAAAGRRGPAVRTSPGRAPAALPADEPLDPLVGIALALVGGLLLGIASQVLQGVLPGAWSTVATSVAVWS